MTGARARDATHDERNATSLTVRVEGVDGDLGVEREAHLPDARFPRGAVDGVEAHFLLRVATGAKGARVSNRSAKYDIAQGTNAPPSPIDQFQRRAFAAVARSGVIPYACRSAYPWVPLQALPQRSPGATAGLQVA